jgi:hypothetical protein
MLNLTKELLASGITRWASMLTRRLVNSPFFRKEICSSELSDRGGCLRGRLPKECRTQFREFRYHPVLELQGAISSGDKKPQNADLQTFYPLFPSGLYYGDMVFTSGSLNAIVTHPSLAMQLSKSLSLKVDSFFLWRQRTTDGLYSQSGMFLRMGQTSLSRYVGATQDLSIGWHVDRDTTVRFLAAYYEVGPYLRETQPPARDTTYLSGIASYTF